MRLSLEVLPTKLLGSGTSSLTTSLLALVPRGTRVYLPSLPGDAPAAMGAALAHLHASAPHVEPVPHIAASRVPSEAELLRRLDSWQEACSNQLSEVLVVRGDEGAHDTAAHGNPTSPRPSGGPFATTLDLLESGALARRGVETVGLCGHPEGIGATVSTGEGIVHLKGKTAALRRAGQQPRIVTQICFDAERATGFVDALRAAEEEAPVSLGLVGPAKAQLLQRMALQCGVRPPPPATEPSELLERVAVWQRLRGQRHGAEAIHIYPFGGLRTTLQWLLRVEGEGVIGLAPPLEAGAKLWAGHE